MKACIHRIDRQPRWPNVILKSQRMPACHLSWTVLLWLDHWRRHAGSSSYGKRHGNIPDELRVAIAFERTRKIIRQSARRTFRVTVYVHWIVFGLIFELRGHDRQNKYGCLSDIICCWDSTVHRSLYPGLLVSRYMRWRMSMRHLWYRDTYRDTWVAIRYAYRRPKYRDTSMHRCIVTTLWIMYSGEHCPVVSLHVVKDGGSPIPYWHLTLHQPSLANDRNLHLSDIYLTSTPSVPECQASLWFLSSSQPGWTL